MAAWGVFKGYLDWHLGGSMAYVWGVDGGNFGGALVMGGSRLVWASVFEWSMALCLAIGIWCLGVSWC